MLKKIILLIIILSIFIFISKLSLDQYNQNHNIATVLKEKLDTRIVPHKVNYKNKLYNILSSDLHAFEFDTNFNTNAKIPYFEVGHDDKELHDISFEDYLKIIKNKKIKKIWMDIKNVNENNIHKILKRLDYLDKTYDIKDILIFETSATTSKVKLISDAGYHTSYYIPIIYALANNIFTAKKLKKQIQDQGLKAVSFPSYLYDFVNTNLKPIIAERIVFHTWATYKFKYKDELKKIKKEKFYTDNRIKTILFTYDNNKLNRLYNF